MLWLAIRRLLAILAVAGVVLAPVTAPGAAGEKSMGMTMPGSASVESDMTLADMPCCPPEKPAVPDCEKACPLASLCLAKLVQAIVPVDVASVRFNIAAALLPRNDAAPDTVSPLPPPRPPQA